MHVDLVGPLPPLNGFKSLITIIDIHTRWPKVIPLKSTAANTCIEAFMLHWVAPFGVPCHLTSNRRPQFTSSLWSGMGSTLGSSLHLTFL